MKTLLFLFVIIIITSCGEQNNQQLPDSKAVAIVGNKPVTADLLSAYMQTNRISNTDQAAVDQALEALITDIAIANIAKKESPNLSPQQLNVLEYQKIRMYANNAKQNYLQKNAVTEAEIKKEYNLANTSIGGKQYHLHLLLYKDEVQAVKQLEKIKTAEDYLEAEKQFTKQNPQMRGVGDIGWVTLTQLPKTFRAEITKMKPYTFLSKVVHSDFGAHILFLEEEKELLPPKLETVKQGIIKTIESKKLSKFRQLARAKANVKLKE